MQQQEQERRSLSVVGGSSVISLSSRIASHHFQRKQRSHLPQAAPSRWWGFKLPVPVLPPARNKREGPCALCGTTETPLWRTWPTDGQVALCNACGIQVRKPGTVLPELVYLRPPPTALPKQLFVDLPPPATARTAAVSELEHPHPQEIQDSESPPDSPILDTIVTNAYLLRRTSPRRDKSAPPPPSPPPLPTAEPESAAAALAPGNEENKPAKKRCQHCSSTSTLRWRTGPAGVGTLCNPCGVTYRKGRLVPEYRPKASPTFDVSVHSNHHRAVLQIRQLQDNPEAPAQYVPIRARMKHRIGTGQQQPRKKRLVNKKNQQPPEPAATQPRASDEMEEHLPPPPPELPHTAGNMEMEQHLPPPPAQPHAGDEMMVEEPMPPPDPFLFNGPPAPVIIDDDEPVVVNNRRPRVVIVIDDED